MKDHEDREDSIKSCTRFSISIGTLTIDVIVKPPKISIIFHVCIYIFVIKIEHDDLEYDRGKWKEGGNILKLYND